jgi:hypothetical protein
MVHEICAEFPRQIDKQGTCSSDQKNRRLIFCSENLITDRDSVGMAIFLPMRSRCMEDGYENHAQNYAEKQSVEVSD